MKGYTKPILPEEWYICDACNDETDRYHIPPLDWPPHNWSRLNAGIKGLPDLDLCPQCTNEIVVNFKTVKEMLEARKIEV